MGLTEIMVSLRRFRFSRESTTSSCGTSHEPDPFQASRHEPKTEHHVKEDAGLTPALHSVLITDPGVLTVYTQPPNMTHTTLGLRRNAAIFHMDLNIIPHVPVPESVVAVREVNRNEDHKQLQSSPAAACQPAELPAASPQGQTSKFGGPTSTKKSRQASGNSSLKCSRCLALQASNSEIIAGSSPPCKKSTMQGSKVDVRNLGHNTAKVTSPNSRKRKKPNSSILTTMERMTSCYKGVGKHVNSKQWEARIWAGDVDQLKRQKGRGQLYLGSYPTEIEAATVHDLVALKLKKKNYTLNFEECTYASELPKMESLSERDYIWSFRRKAQRFTRGKSVYKGVSRQSGGGTKWEGRVGYKHEDTGKRIDVYLGVHPTEVEAARAVDMASLHYRGWDDAVTNFAPSQYNKEAVEEHLQRVEKKRYSIPAALLQYWSQFQASS